MRGWGCSGEQLEDERGLTGARLSAEGEELAKGRQETNHPAGLAKKRAQ